MYEVIAFPTIDMKRTGRQIERLRKDRGLTVRELQAYFGFEHPQAIYKWQWGESLPSVDNLFALARLLRVPMQDLLVGTDQEAPPLTIEHTSPDPAGSGLLLLIRARGWRSSTGPRRSGRSRPASRGHTRQRSQSAQSGSSAWLRRSPWVPRSRCGGNARCQRGDP